MAINHLHSSSDATLLFVTIMSGTPISRLASKYFHWLHPDENRQEKAVRRKETESQQISGILILTSLMLQQFCSPSLKIKDTTDI
jgi:hypothetical protein